MLGYTFTEITKLNYADLTPKQWLEEDKKKIAEAVEKGHCEEYEKELEKKDGGEITISLKIFLTEDEEKKSKKIWGIARDITESKQAEEALRESEERYKALYDNAVVAMFRTSIEDGKALAVNDSGVRLFGYSSKEEFLTEFKALEHYVNFDDRKRLLDELQKGHVDNFQVELLRKDGTTFWTEVSAHLYPSKGYLEGAVIDITERKQAEEALRESEERFRNLFDTMTEGVVLISPEGLIIQANPAAESILGLTRSEIESRNYVSPEWEILRPDGTPMPPEEMAGPRAMKEQHSVKNVEMGVKRPDDSIRWINVSASPFFYQTGNLGGIVGTFVDITERKQMEETLRTERDQLEALTNFQNEMLNTAAIWIDTLDPEGNVTFWNRAAEAISGYTAEEVVGHANIWEWLYPDPDYRAEIVEKAQAIIHAGERVENFETRIRTKNGQYKTISWHSNNLIEDGKIVGSIALGADITGPKETEEALRESEEKYRELADSITDVFFAMDKDLRYTYWNQASETLTGIAAKDAIGKNIFEIFRDSEDTKRAASVYQEVLKTQQPQYMVNEFQLEGTTHFFEISAYPSKEGLSVFVRDITERKQLEQEMLRLERLRAVGELAAGVSHNLNNMLVSVLGPAQLLKRKTDDPELLGEADHIIAGARRARDLVQRLNRAVRDEEESELVPVPIHPVIQDAIQAARPRWKDESEAQGITIEVVSQLEEVPDIRGTGTGLHDILLNLLFNAVDAIPEGGTITLATQEVDEGVQLTVRDTGIGMDEETRKRVFEPFFTTKQDVGSGLGLSTVHGTVTRWGGRIEVESEPGQGTTFMLWFPAWGRWEVPSQEAAATERLPVRPGRLLIVEDDEGTCRLLDRLLSETHEVETVLNGREALERFAPGRYDAVLIDLAMPGMPGDQVAREMHQIDPSVVTVLITGWDVRPDDPRLWTFDYQLQKPFKDLDEVETVVAQAIARHNALSGNI